MPVRICDTWNFMTNKDHTSKPSRRKSDLTLLSSSSQDLDDWVYTLEFGVNLEKTSFEGLNNYSVANTRTDKKNRRKRNPVFCP